jgi:hypothetical protein
MILKTFNLGGYMITGFEFMNKENRTIRLYFREEGKETLINKKSFIDKANVSVTQKEITKQSNEFKDLLIKKVEGNKEKIKKIKDTDLKDIIKNKIESEKKIEKGTKDFEVFINDIIYFIEKKFKEVK